MKKQRCQTQKMVINCLKNILLAVLAIQISSCTQTHLVIRQQPDAWAQRVNATAEKNRGKVYFKNRDVALAQKISVSGDSVNWTDRLSRETASVNLNEVSTITLIKKGRGGGEGFLLGLAGGVLGGVLIGLISGDDPPRNFLGFSAEQKAKMFGASLGVLGGLTGWIIGKNFGSKDKYILINESPDKLRVISVDKAIRSQVPVRGKGQ